MNRTLLIILGVVAAMAATLATVAIGQDAPPRGDGAAVLEPTPRLPDGTVNLGRVNGEKGAWDLVPVRNFAGVTVGGPVARPSAPLEHTRRYGRDGGGTEQEPWMPFKPWSAAVYNYRAQNYSKYDPQAMCLPSGVPRLMAVPYPMEIIQQPESKRIVMIFEGSAHVWREIYMDGRPHPPANSFDGSNLWLGHSIGHYEDNGSTLVVDVVGFNEGTWLDAAGHPHTNQLHVIEKYSRPNKRTLHYEATIDDPGAYSKPWTVKWDISWQDRDLLEYICQSNNPYLNNLKDDFGEQVFVKGP